MSRIGERKLVIPDGVVVTVNGNDVTVKGPKGELSLNKSKLVSVEVVENTVLTKQVKPSKEANIMQGTTNSLVNNMIIGVSAHNVEEAKAAEAGGADYLGVGAIYATTTKPDATYVPLNELKRICKAVRIPVVAIGGMERSTISKLSGTGVDGVAMVSAIFAAENIEQECRRLLRQSKDMVYEMER